MTKLKLVPPETVQRTGPGTARRLVIFRGDHRRMLRELVLIGLVILGGVGVSQLWTRQQRGWSVVLCLAIACGVIYLARRWRIDLSAVA